MAESNLEQKKSSEVTLKDCLRALGPGILLAGAAIGGSHIYQSTRAGANFGWSLLWLVVLANVLKYPFFDYAIRYQAATGRNLLQGFKSVHPLLLYLVMIIVYISGALNITALTIGSGALLANYFSAIPFGVQGWSIAVAVTSVFIVFVGRYSVLDVMTKIIVSVLSFTTILAFFVALSKGMQADPSIAAPEVYISANLATMLALMGWMPLPIDASIWPTLWSCEKAEEQGHRISLKEQLFDFNFGYISAGALSFFFLGLGALVLYRTGADLEGTNTAFAVKLFAIYESQFGSIAKWFVGIAAATALFSSALTCYDAYPRTLYYGAVEIFGTTYNRTRCYITIGGLATTYLVISLIVVFLFLQNVQAVVDYATIVAFLTAPVMAVANLLVVLHPSTPKEARPGKVMLVFGGIGLLFLVAFSGLWVYVRFVL